MAENTKNLNGIGRENPFLVLGFIEFAIIATLMVSFFPWSLIFCLFIYGIEGTKLLVVALLHDLLKTAGAVILVLSFIVIITLFVVMLFH